MVSGLQSLRCRGLLLLSMLFVSGATYAQVTQVQVSVDKNPVLVDEPLVVTIEVDDNVDRSAVNTDVFLDNFMVGRTSVSHQRSIINGRASATTTFRVVITAQTEGEFRIPPIEIDGVRSQPITLQVVAEREDTEGSRGTAFLTAAIDNESLYVQQQFTYVAKLYLAADLSGGNIIPPELEGGDVTQVGKDSESLEMVDGQRYKVYQREYAISPNRSGNFAIKGATFEGEIYRQRSDSLFSTFANTVPVTAKAPPIEIQVKPVPSDWQGDWLPSELVSLTRELNPAQGPIDVGEPVTLTYMLTAVGVKPEQLPELDIPEINGARSYPEQPEVNSFVRNGTSISQVTQQVAIIPNQAGELVIPAQSLTWFNTRTDKSAVIEIDEQRLQVAGISISESAPRTRSTNTTATTTEVATPNQNTSEPLPATENLTWWQWLAGISIALWLLTVAVFGYAWQRGWLAQGKTPANLNAANGHQSKAQNTSQSTSKQWRALQRACKANQPREVSQYLLAWGQSRFTPAPATLTQLAEHLASPQLNKEIERLQRQLYASSAQADWQQGKALYQALHNALANDVATPNDSAKLPPLYGR
ncbi:MAG: BatD family protein [Idiomarina sp.]